MTAARDYDPSDPVVRRDPHPYYAALRREAPVFRIPSSGLLAISRYEDVLTVLRQTPRFSSEAMETAVNRPNAYAPTEAGTPAAASRTVSIIGMDPPEHTRLRDIVNRGFTPGRIAILEPRIREIARDLAARLPRGETYDWSSRSPCPFP